MKILVTGGRGFLGKPLVEALSQRNEVIVLSRHIDKCKRLKNVQYIEADLLHLDDLAIDKNFDALIHVAALVPRTNDQDIAREMIDVNVVGTINLLENFHRTNRIIFISTAETYGPYNSGLINDNLPQYPVSFYGASKTAAEKFCQAFCYKNNKKLTILRMSNIYGPGETINRAIPNFIKAALKNEPIMIFGDGTELRDFIFIDDAIGGIVAALESDNGGVYNLGYGKGVSIKEVAELIIKLSNSSSNIVFTSRAKEKYDVILDTSKLSLLNYQPSTPLEEGLVKEIEWFKEHGNIL